jgi:hypothetical protein
MHTTVDSIRRRIAHEEKQIRVLTENGLGHVNKALDAHHELIRVLSERLDELLREQTETSVRNGREQSQRVKNIGEREKAPPGQGKERRSLTDTVNEPVRQHLRKVLARLSAHTRAGHEKPNAVRSLNTAVEVEREENTPRGVGDVQRPP